MAQKKGTQNVPIDTLRIDAFSGGMNTSGSARDIAPNECSLIENLEFDDFDNLVTRNGNLNSFISTVGPITSVFSFNTDTGFVGILNTAQAQLFSHTLTGAASTLTGALVLPSGTKWYWKALNNVAVGVNGSTGAGNPIQVVGPAPGTASHLAAAPDGKYIEEWNSRLVIAHVSNPNRIQISDLGTATVWNTDGATIASHGVIIDVAPGDGDVITALYAFKERLFIFKKKKIYVLRSVAIPNTDPNTWEVVEYAKNIGCISQSSVREAFDDVVFLSEGGLASLSAAEIAADFTSAIISGKISEIQKIKKDALETSILGFALTDRSQYWLAVDSSASPTGTEALWVMDYKQIKKGLRWVTFSGGIFPTAMDLYNGGGQQQATYILGITTAVNSGTLTVYRPNTPVKERVFIDKISSTISRPIISRIHTKAFDFDLDDIRKIFKEWYLRYNVISNKARFKISYEMDDPLSPVVSYNFDDYSLDFRQEQLVRQAFIHDVQRKSVSCRFVMTFGGQLDQGVSIKNFGISFGVLNQRRSESMVVTTTIKNVSYVIERNRAILGNIGGGADVIFNSLIPFDSLKSDGDFFELLSAGNLANNNNDKAVLFQLEGDPITGAGGDFVTGISAALDLDAASINFDSWLIYARVTRISATTVNVAAWTKIGQIFADGAAALSVTNGLVRADSRNITVANLNLVDLVIQILGTGIADNDVTHKQTIVQLNQG